MRYFEITSGMRVPVSGEERAFLNRVEAEGPIVRSDLDERQAEVARQMVTRGLLLPVRKDQKVAYAANTDPNLRRF